MNDTSLSVIPAELERFQRICLRVGIVFLAVLLLGAVLDPTQFFQSYLTAWLYWSSLALGALAIVMLQYMTGGAWGLVIRRLMESATRTLPLVAILFIPLLLGLQRLYVWARPEAVAADELLQHKSLYLNVPFFLVRALFYFGVWLALSFFLNRWARQQDERGSDARHLRRFQILSAPGLVLFMFTMTFASVDWVMSLEPHWFSTIFGALLVAGQGVAGLSLGIAAVILLSRYRPLSEVVTAGHLHDLGKLLLAFVMVWAYFGFSQYLIIWSGNLPEEIPWYLRRLQGGWEWAALALVLLHFVLPFLLLLSRNLKRDARPLARVAILMLVMHLVDIYWMTEPAFGEAGLSLHWMDIVAPVALGGLWLAFFAAQLRRRPLLPIRDPLLAEVLEHESH